MKNKSGFSSIFLQNIKFNNCFFKRHLLGKICLGKTMSVLFVTTKYPILWDNCPNPKIDVYCTPYQKENKKERYFTDCI